MLTISTTATAARCCRSPLGPHRLEGRRRALRQEVSGFRLGKDAFLPVSGTAFFVPGFHAAVGFRGGGLPIFPPDIQNRKYYIFFRRAERKNLAGKICGNNKTLPLFFYRTRYRHEPHTQEFPTGLEEVYAKYKPYFVRIAVSYVRDRMAAEDLVSDTFLKVWRTARRRRPATCPPTC